MDKKPDLRQISISGASDFLCERRLRELDPALHRCYQSSVFAMDRLLANYKAVFPFYTNHTFEHSAQVINYCNVVAGEKNISRLNADELYLLLMGAALHDVGLGISESDYAVMKTQVAGLEAYEQAHRGDTVAQIVREFHQEFSGEFVKKYSALFEIPSPAHVDCIRQIVRGHRRAELTDDAGFPPYCQMPDGTSIRLRYLAALVKMADELDIAADRNLFFDYSYRSEKWSEEQRMCYECHAAIKRVETDGRILRVLYQSADEAVLAEIARMQEKAQKTFCEYCAAVGAYPELELQQTDVVFSQI